MEGNSAFGSRDIANINSLFRGNLRDVCKGIVFMELPSKWEEGDFTHYGRWCIVFIIRHCAAFLVIWRQCTKDGTDRQLDSLLYGTRVSGSSHVCATVWFVQ